MYEHLRCWTDSGDIFFEDPLFGSDFRIDELPRQIEKAEKALLERERFSIYGPSDAPPLPIEQDQWSRIKYRDPLSHLVAQYCISLRANDWDSKTHPDFEPYARGVMASPFAAEIVRTDQAMHKRFPPRELKYIHQGMVWRPEPPSKRS
jgi:hypothetical protein